MDANGDHQPAPPASPTSSPNYTIPSTFPVCLCVAFPVLQQAADSAVLVEWAGAMEVGRETPEDPVEGTDLVAGLNAALVRARLPARVVVYANDTIATLFTAAFEYGAGGECLLAVVVGAGVNACYREANASAHFGFRGRLLDLECGNLNRGLPMTSVDYELDFARPQTQGHNLLEKMISLGYLGELARRCLLNILQEHAPALAWQDNSLTAQQVIAIADDSSVAHDRTKTIIQEAWGRMPHIGP